MNEPPIPQGTSREPTDEERRHAVCGAIAWSQRLLRYAGRYSADPDDAQDAYQRAMEIALTRAPVVEQGAFLGWLYAVVRNEARAVARERRREETGADDVLDAVVSPHAPDTIVEWRQRHRELQEALEALTPSERTCMTLYTAGLRHAEIAEQTGFSRRKVERSVLEGRQRLRDWEVRLRQGDECQRIAPAIARLADEEPAGSMERRRVSRHIEHCGACRGELRTMRARRMLLVATVPSALMPSAALASQPPDPGLVSDTWDRLATAGNVKAGSLMQSLFDMSAATLVKLGAATAAGAMVLGAAVGPQRAPDRPAVAVVPATPARPTVVPPPPVAVTPRRVARTRRSARPVRRSPAPRAVARHVVVRAAPTLPSAMVRRAAPTSGGAAAEFGP